MIIAAIIGGAFAYVFVATLFYHLEDRLGWNDANSAGPPLFIFWPLWVAALPIWLGNKTVAAFKARAERKKLPRAEVVKP